MAEAKPAFGNWGSASEELLKTQFPLHCACRDGEVEKLALLLREAQHGIYAEDSFYGWTPAHWAAYFGKLNCLMRLLDNGVNCDVTTVRLNQTPTHIAAFGGHSHCLKWLLHCGASLNRQDYLGETPLHKTARTGTIECSSLLVSHGADISIRNYNGLTASELAKTCNYTECARYLEGAAVITEQNQLRGINQELLPPILPPAQPENQRNGGLQQLSGQSAVNSHLFHPSVPVQNGHMIGHHGHMNGSPDNDCEMEMESDESHTPVVNGLSHSGQCAVSGGMNGFTNGHLNGHSNGHQNGSGEGHLGDVMLDAGVSTNQIPIGGKKRVREDEDMVEMKRMRTLGDCPEENDVKYEAEMCGVSDENDNSVMRNIHLAEHQQQFPARCIGLTGHYI